MTKKTRRLLSGMIAVAVLGGVSARLRPLVERIERMKKDGGQNGA